MPQIKKQDVELRILDAAYSEFFEKGFEKASIRSIVKRAKTNIGNFYNYFESKEQVFENLVLDVYNGLAFLIENHNDEHGDNNDFDIKMLFENKDILKNLLDEVTLLFDKRFLLLMEKSDGTKFSSAKSNLIQILSEHFFEHMNALNSDYKHPEMADIIAKQFITGVIEILKKNCSEEIKKNLIIEHLLYTTYGTFSLLTKNSYQIGANND